MSTELWDLYTESRECTGKTHIRGEELPDGLYHLVVHVWIKNSSGDYIVSQRSANRPTCPLMWECVGGSVLQGESSREAAIRETMEEIGVDLSDCDGKLLFSKVRKTIGDRKINDIVDVWLFAYDGEITLAHATTDEVAQAKWMNAEQIRELYSDRKLVKFIAFFEEMEKGREEDACWETMFLCPACKQSMHLPQCSCGYKIIKANKIWQLSDAPDIVLSGDGDKYVGYEHIGETYSGTRKYMIEEADALVAKEIAAETGTGIFLDLACGDGCFTVPCASLGVKTIAGDISNAMLKVLQEKADYNHISLDTVTLCRMNALDIPLADETVDTVIANSVLHLISNPERVLSEIYRVLKPNGCFLCIDDLPGKNVDTSFDNSKYTEIVNFIYSDYWQKLNAMGIQPVKYSWKFNRQDACDALFKARKETEIQMSGISKISISDSFLPRFSGRGFSDQVDVPEELHRTILEQTLTEAKRLFGKNFECTTCTSVREDILITKYYK